MNSVRIRNILVISILVLIAFFLFQSLDQEQSQKQVLFSDFLNWVEEGSVSRVLLKGDNISFETTQGVLQTTKPLQYNTLADFLYQNGVQFRVLQEEGSSLLFAILLQWLPFLLLIGVWLFFMRQMQGGGGIMKMGDFKSDEENSERPEITFKDVAGIDEALGEVEEIVDYLKAPEKFRKLGGKIPSGVLLSGKPGTGKTLLAKAIAGEAKVKFFSVSGSDFVEMFVGVGASRVRKLFDKARENTPCIVFIDEIDAVGRNRGSGIGGGNDEREQTLNQLLVEMDGFGGTEGIIVVAATNRPDVLDPALTRPGRFDRSVVVPPPDYTGRVKILQIHSEGVKIADDVDLKVIARGTQGYTGAELANLVNEAALLAGREQKTHVDKEDFEAARDKIMMGNERRSLSMKEKELKTTAYHEAGHAIIAAVSEHVDPVHKVTIVPRGRALGVTMLVPEEEKHSYSYSKLIAMLKMMMGGRAAEELVFQHYTTGAANDLERATDIAHNMICCWGMSEELGPIYLSNSNDGGVFLGKDMMRRNSISQKISQKIDAEVKRIVNTAYTDALDILQKNIDALHDISQKLLSEETIDGQVVTQLIEARTQS